MKTPVTFLGGFSLWLIACGACLISVALLFFVGEPLFVFLLLFFSLCVFVLPYLAHLLSQKNLNNKMSEKHLYCKIFLVILSRIFSKVVHSCIFVVKNIFENISLQIFLTKRQLAARGHCKLLSLLYNHGVVANSISRSVCCIATMGSTPCTSMRIASMFGSTAAVR